MLFSEMLQPEFSVKGAMSCILALLLKAERQLESKETQN